MDTNRVKTFFESYNKCDAIDILRELTIFVDGLPALTKDEESRALSCFTNTDGLTLRETRERIIDGREKAKDDK